MVIGSDGCELVADGGTVVNDGCAMVTYVAWTLEKCQHVRVGFSKSKVFLLNLTWVQNKVKSLRNLGGRQWWCSVVVAGSSGWRLLWLVAVISNGG